MLNFCAISPTPHLNLVKGRTAVLTLAHLIESDSEYRDWYKNEDAPIHIMDNSAFEMVQLGQELFNGDKLDSLAKAVGAEYVAMTDAPGVAARITIEYAVTQSRRLREQGLGTFFVPQSEYGDLSGLVDSFLWGLTNPDIDYVALSILSAPNALCIPYRQNKEAVMMNRYMSRFRFMTKLEKESIFRYGMTARSLKEKHYKRIHFLGMTDGPFEIELMSRVNIPIDTWDSSSPIWLGLHGTFNDKMHSYWPKGRYDLNSSTGLPHGKYPVHVDFNYRTNLEKAKDNALYNLAVIDGLVAEYNNIIN